MMSTVTIGRGVLKTADIVLYLVAASFVVNKPCSNLQHKLLIERLKIEIAGNCIDSF